MIDSCVLVAMVAGGYVSCLAIFLYLLLRCCFIEHVKLFCEINIMVVMVIST